MALDDEERSALASLADAISQLTGAVHDLAVDATDRAAETKRALEVQAQEIAARDRRQVRRTRWIGAGVILIVVALGGQAYNSITSRSILREVQSVTNPDAVKTQHDATTKLLSDFAIQLDCQERRMQVRLPAPDPTKSCISQTDSGVYPGTPGVPARPGG